MDFTQKKKKKKNRRDNVGSGDGVQIGTSWSRLDAHNIIIIAVIGSRP